MITQASLDAFFDYHGIKIVDSRIVGDYQGDEIVVVFDPKSGQYGYLVHGYGSCSGCDVLYSFAEDLDRTDPNGDWADTATPGEYERVCQGLTEYALRVVEMIDWYPSAYDLTSHLVDLANAETDENDWYSFVDEFRTAFRELAASVLLHSSN